MSVTPIAPVSAVSPTPAITLPGSPVPAAGFIDRTIGTFSSFERSLGSSTRRESLRKATANSWSLFSEEDSDVVSLSPELSASILQQTHTFSRTLLENLHEAGIPTEDLITLDIDETGIVRAANAYAQKIDQLFADNPGLSRQANTIVMLNTLEAMQEAARRYEWEINTAETDEEKQEAQARYDAHLAEINQFSSSLRFENETLSFVALNHINRSNGDTA